MVSQKRRGLHTNLGEVYHWNMLVVCVTAAIMAVLNWGKSGYFLFIAVFSYYSALKAYLAVKRRYSGWLHKHISGMIGSYIALVTASLVVNVDRIPGLNQLPVLFLWLLPTLIGTPIIFKIQRRLPAGK